MERWSFKHDDSLKIREQEPRCSMWGKLRSSGEAMTTAAFSTTNKNTPAYQGSDEKRRSLRELNIIFWILVERYLGKHTRRTFDSAATSGRNIMRKLDYISVRKKDGLSKKRYSMVTFKLCPLVILVFLLFVS
jgi:hypothetical protein